MATRKWRKRQREQRQFWKNATEQDRYEYLVDSDKAPNEIRDFHKCEEQKLLDLICKHVERREKIAFIEIGCGPGRIIRKVSRMMLENPNTWGKSIEYVVGVDFEIGMIDRAIESLVRKERPLRDLRIKGVTFEVAESMNRPAKEVEKDIHKSVFFINADARFPFLRCESITPIVAVMFGTLGNIPETNCVLQRVAEICWPKGEALLVVFDRAKKDIGEERYPQLASLDFAPLNGTQWNDEGAEGMGFFKSDFGFYSRWFHKAELRGLFEKYFEKGFEIEPACSVGLFATVRPKFKLMMHRRLMGFLVRKQASDKLPYLRLMCPVHGDDLKNGEIPFKQNAVIQCSEDTHPYMTHEFRGFHVPVLERPMNGA